MRVVLSTLVFDRNLSHCVVRDADDAVHARDGYDYDGYRLRVEFPRGGGHGSFRGGRGGGDRGRSSRGPPARRSQFRVLVTGKRGCENRGAPSVELLENGLETWTVSLIRSLSGLHLFSEDIWWPQMFGVVLSVFHQS